MANNFFEGLDGLMDGLGGKISKKAKELSGQAETLYEVQKLRNKISSANRSVEKAKADLGNIIYKQYIAGAELSEEQKVLCEHIDDYMHQIHTCEEAIADIQGKQICPSCQQKVSGDALFCPNCGAACTTTAEEPEEEDVIDGEAKEVDPKCEEDAEAENASTENEEMTEQEETDEENKE